MDNLIDLTHSNTSSSSTGPISVDDPQNVVESMAEPYQNVKKFKTESSSSSSSTPPPSLPHSSVVPISPPVVEQSVKEEVILEFIYKDQSDVVEAILFNAGVREEQYVQFPMDARFVNPEHSDDDPTAHSKCM
jgi:hypothetical protein